MNNSTMLTSLNVETMTSVEIAEVTGRRHDNVIRDIKNLIEQLDEKGVLNFEESSYLNSQNKKQPMYILTKKGCLCLASGYRADLRMAIINRWEELELEKQRNMLALPDFTNPAEAAIAWAEQYKAKEAAQLEAKKEKAARIEVEARIKRLVHDSKTFTSGEIADELGFKSAQALNKELAKRHIQYKQNGTWVLYSAYSGKGYTDSKTVPLDSGFNVYDRQWTGKGRDFLLSLFEGVDVRPLKTKKVKRLSTLLKHLNDDENTIIFLG